VTASRRRVACLPDIFFAIMFDRKSNIKIKFFIPNGRWRVHPGPAPEDPRGANSPGRRVPGPDDIPEDGVDGWRLVPCRADWPDEAGYQAALDEEEEPPDPDLWEDPDSAPPAGLDDVELAALTAGARVVTAAGFAAGTPLDAGPGCTALMGFADDAAGPGTGTRAPPTMRWSARSGPGIGSRPTPVPVSTPRSRS